MGNERLIQSIGKGYYNRHIQELLDVGFDNIDLLESKLNEREPKITTHRQRLQSMARLYQQEGQMHYKFRNIGTSYYRNE